MNLCCALLASKQGIVEIASKHRIFEAAAAKLILSLVIWPQIQEGKTILS